MKITSFICQYQDPEYLDAALTNFKSVPDKLYIIEGAWQTSYKEGEPNQSGTDVYKIIEKHVDDKKVFLIQANEKNETAQRQLGLEKAKEDGADFCWMLDSDEIYTASVIAGIKNILNRAQENCYTFKLRSFNFINSFNRWYDGRYSRIYRVKKNAEFVGHNDVNFHDMLRWHTTYEIPEALRFYHYNYVKKDPKQFYNKMRACSNDIKDFKKNDLPNYGFSGMKYKIPADIPIFTYTGRHPKIMQTHPNFVNNIYNDQNLKFLSE